MEHYDFDTFNKEWIDHLKSENINNSIAKRVYSTRDYYYTCWENAKHGVLVLDFSGTIIDVNPYFCEMLGYSIEELKGKKINNFSVRADDLYSSDSINILTLLQGSHQQATNRCDVESKEHKLIRCRWCANRIPADLKYPFSHSIVHVYFLGDIGFNTIVNEITKLKEQNIKNDKWLSKFLDSTWTRVGIILIILLTALGGSLPDIITQIINIFSH